MLRPRWAVAAPAAIMAIAVAVALSWPRDRANDAPAGPAAAPWQALAVEGDFARPRFPREFHFPADHAAHPAYRSEWWQLAGILEDTAGNRVGMQAVFLRLAIAAKTPRRPSNWATNQIYAALFTLSDPARGHHHSGNRASRGAVGLAGAEPERLWVEDWQLRRDEGQVVDARLRSGDVRLDLRLEPEKGLVEEGEIRAPFHFYLQPRLRASGVLHVGKAERPLRGTATLEHAWGELPLPGGPVAVDRFTLHLDDGRELLLNRSHRAGGGGSPEAIGLLVGSGGDLLALAPDAVRLEPTAWRRSERSGARYPTRWSLSVPGHDLNWDLVPLGEAQEGFAWFPFWAGPVRVDARSPDASGGHGFVQLTGYRQ